MSTDNARIYQVVMLADHLGNVIDPASTAAAASTGTTDSNNSTSTALSAGGTFTGEWVNAEAYNSIVVAVKTDQNGYFQVQFSVDATNIDSTLIRYYHTDQIEAPHRFTITRKYVRVVFVNTSNSAQTYLRLQCLLGEKENLNIPQDAVMSQDYDAIATRPTDFYYEVALDRRQNQIQWNKFGEVDSLDVSDGEVTLWVPQETLIPMTSAETFTITYDNTTDGLNRPGARQLQFWYLDEYRIAKSAAHTLGSSGTDVTTFSGVGINRVSIVSAGSAFVNTNDISIDATSAGSTQAFIEAGAGITEQCFFFTQNKHKFITDWLYFNVNKLAGGGAPRATIKGYVRDFNKNTRIKIFDHVIDSAVENTVELLPPHPFVIGGNSLLEFTISTTVNATLATLRFSGIEVADIDGD